MASFITKNFLDNEGLKAFWRLIKQYIEDYVADKLEVDGEIKWDNILNKPTISTVSNASSHTHTAEFSDTEGHTHTFSGTSGTTSSVEDHVHSVNFTSGLSEGHTHTFTPSGNVTLKVVSLDGGVLTLGAEFAGNSLTTELTDKHTHTISGTSNSAGGHEHNFTPAGSVNNGKATGTVTSSIDITSTSAAAGGHEHSFTPAGSVNNGKATGTVTVNNETAHKHVIEIDLNKNFSSDSIIIQVSGSEFEEIINSQDNERYIQFMAKNTYLANNLTSLAVSPKDLEKLNDPNLAFIVLLYHDNINDDEDIFNVMPIGLVPQGVNAGALELNENKVFMSSNHLNGMIASANSYGENTKIGVALGYLREDSSFPQIIDSIQHIN